MTETTIMRAHGELTLPERIRAAARLEENDALAVELTPEGILLKPIALDPNQAWYWTPEWQEGEREVEAQMAAGQGTVYMSTEEFFAALDAHAGHNADV